MHNSQAWPKTLTILGGSGFLGRSLIHKLLTVNDLEIRNVDLVPLPVDSRTTDRVREFIGDVRDQDFLTRALSGTNAVWIRSALLGGEQSIRTDLAEPYLQINADAVHGILQAVTVSGCQRVILDSTIMVFGQSTDLQPATLTQEPEPRNFYGATKLIAEQLVRAWSFSAPDRSAQVLRYARVREASTQDVIFHMVAAAMDSRPIQVVGNGKRRIEFVHLTDVITSNLLALQRSPRFELHHISSGGLISLDELAQKIQSRVLAVTGVHVPIQQVEAPCASEPTVLGLEWKTSFTRLGLPTPKSMEEMIEETVEFLRNKTA